MDCKYTTSKCHKNMSELINKYIDEIESKDISDGNIKIMVYMNKYLRYEPLIEKSFRDKYLGDHKYLSKVKHIYEKILCKMTEKYSNFYFGNRDSSKYIEHIIPEIIDGF